MIEPLWDGTLQLWKARCGKRTIQLLESLGHQHMAWARVKVLGIGFFGGLKLCRAFLFCSLLTVNFLSAAVHHLPARYGRAWAAGLVKQRKLFLLESLNLVETIVYLFSFGVPSDSFARKHHETDSYHNCFHQRWWVDKFMKVRAARFVSAGHPEPAERVAEVLGHCNLVNLVWADALDLFLKCMLQHDFRFSMFATFALLNEFMKICALKW